LWGQVVIDGQGHAVLSVVLSFSAATLHPFSGILTILHRRGLHFGDTMTATKRVLLVTGGGRGIGAATAILAAQQGWAVAVNYAQDAQAAAKVVSAIQAQGGQAQAFQANVAEEEQVMAMFTAIDQHMGRLSGLVNNAGVVDVYARVDEMSVARLKRMFDVNVLGSFICAREAVRRMSPKHGGNGGSIVNVSSAASRIGSPGQYVDYASAKGAIDTFTLGLAKEVAAEGIRVNAVRPGLIDTEIHASGGLPNRVKDLQHLIPAQRGGTAQEVAQAIVWLLSDAASYTTMSLLDVSGGR
jgi:NAD(P)-dependent dehydrogenase (short-subunit alcohol dehydrogenase family)